MHISLVVPGAQGDHSNTEEMSPTALPGRPKEECKHPPQALQLNKLFPVSRLLGCECCWALIQQS